MQINMDPIENLTNALSNQQNTPGPDLNDNSQQLQKCSQITDTVSQDNQNIPTQEQRAAIIEALLFASAQPLSLNDLSLVCKWPKNTIVEDVRYLSLSLSSTGLRVQKIAGAWRLVTAPFCSLWVKDMLKANNRRQLSKSQLETLAVVAYRQPLTRADIEAYRGVKCDRTIRQLEELRLIRKAGHADLPGKPVLFETTVEFLKYFSLDKIEELPIIQKDKAKFAPKGSKEKLEDKNNQTKTELNKNIDAEKENILKEPEEISEPSSSLRKLFDKIRKKETGNLQ